MQLLDHQIRNRFTPIAMAPKKKQRGKRLVLIASERTSRARHSSGSEIIPTCTLLRFLIAPTVPWGGRDDIRPYEPVKA
jgi:hypothetical protein